MYWENMGNLNYSYINSLDVLLFLFLYMGVVNPFEVLLPASSSMTFSSCSRISLIFVTLLDTPP